MGGGKKSVWLAAGLLACCLGVRPLAEPHGPRGSEKEGLGSKKEGLGSEKEGIGSE